MGEDRERTGEIRQRQRTDQYLFERAARRSERREPCPSEEEEVKKRQRRAPPLPSSRNSSACQGRQYSVSVNQLPMRKKSGDEERKWENDRKAKTSVDYDTHGENTQDTRRTRRGVGRSRRVLEKSKRNMQKEGKQFRRLTGPYRPTSCTYPRALPPARLDRAYSVARGAPWRRRRRLRSSA